MDVDERAGSKVPRSRSRSRHPAPKLPGRDVRGLSVDPSARQPERARKMMKKAQRKQIQFGRAGEADRHIVDKMPKHMFSGKRRMGKTDRR